MWDLTLSATLYEGNPFSPHWLNPSALHGDVVGAFGLVEVDGSVVAVPERLVFFEMFDEEAVGGDVVAVDGEAVVGGVDVPACPAGGVGVVGTVVGAPEPDVVEEDVVGVDCYAVLGGGGGGGAADAAGDVEEGGWVGGVVGLLPGGPMMRRDGEGLGPASKRIPLMETPGMSAILMAGVLVVGTRVAIPRPRIQVLGWLTV